MSITLPSLTVADPAAQRNFEHLRGYGASSSEVDTAETSIAATDAVYRTLFSSKGFITTDAVAGTYMLGTVFGGVTNTSFPSGSGALGSYNYAPDLFRIDDDDYAITGRTTQMRVIATVAANATAPAINFTFGLYPVTVAGGADDIDFTYGTVVTGSTVAINTPSSSTITGADGNAFTAPTTAGGYGLGVVTSGTIANNSAVAVYAALQMRHT